MADHLWGFADGYGIPNSQSKAQEDHSWHLATSKLAFAEQMRAQSDWASPPHPKTRSCELKDLPYESRRGPYYDDKTANHMKGMNFKPKPADDGMNQTFTDCDMRSGVSNLGLKFSSCSHGFSDKRFKSLPPAEVLPRSEPLGGYIFVCNNDTMAEDLKRQLFGLPQRYRDSVRAIQPGLPLFLYNYTTHQLYGVYEAASFGGSNIDPTAWEDKKCRGQSRFPAQVRVRARNIAKPLEEDSFRPVLHHYDGPKFRLQLSIPETLALLDLFSDNAMV